MNPKELICPVSTERINERVTRFNALFTIVLVVTGVYFHSAIILLLLAADFYIRAFTSLKTSPLSYISQNMVAVFKLDRKPIDKAPKIFAARLGFLMSLFIVIFSVAGLQSAALVIAGILTLFASLELLFGFCAGCYVYSYIALVVNPDKP